MRQRIVHYSSLKRFLDHFNPTEYYLLFDYPSPTKDSVLCIFQMMCCYSSPTKDSLLVLSRGIPFLFQSDKIFVIINLSDIWKWSSEIWKWTRRGVSHTQELKHLVVFVEMSEISEIWKGPSEGYHTAQTNVVTCFCGLRISYTHQISKSSVFIKCLRFLRDPAKSISHARSQKPNVFV